MRAIEQLRAGVARILHLLGDSEASGVCASGNETVTNKDDVVSNKSFRIFRDAKRRASLLGASARALGELVATRPRSEKDVMDDLSSRRCDDRMEGQRELQTIPTTALINVSCTPVCCQYTGPLHRQLTCCTCTRNLAFAKRN